MPARDQRWEGAKLALWLALVLAWLGGLLLGLWQAWPLLRAPVSWPDLVAAGMWLILGATAWVAALSLGWQRYRRRPGRHGVA